MPRHASSIFFFFNDTATTEIYTLSLHDALPIWIADNIEQLGDTLTRRATEETALPAARIHAETDRKSTRLNSSHLVISYAVFCLKKKTNKRHTELPHLNAPSNEAAHPFVATSTR